MERALQVRISPAEISAEKVERRCEVSTPRTDALCPPDDARDVIADLLAKAVPAAAESGDKGMVFVEMTEAEWQRVVEATVRAKAFLASGEGML